MVGAWVAGSVGMGDGLRTGGLPGSRPFKQRHAFGVRKHTRLLQPTLTKIKMSVSSILRPGEGAALTSLAAHDGYGGGCA